jgi:hypothetical protein
MQGVAAAVDQIPKVTTSYAPILVVREPASLRSVLRMDAAARASPYCTGIGCCSIVCSTGWGMRTSSTPSAYFAVIVSGWASNGSRTRR